MVTITITITIKTKPISVSIISVIFPELGCYKLIYIMSNNRIIVLICAGTISNIKVIYSALGQISHL